MGDSLASTVLDALCVVIIATIPSLHAQADGAHGVERAWSHGVGRYRFAAALTSVLS